MMFNKRSATGSTQPLTALAAPEDLPDWRLVLAVEAVSTAGMLDALPGTAQQIGRRTGTDPAHVRTVLAVLDAWGFVVQDSPDDGARIHRTGAHGAWGPSAGDEDATVYSPGPAVPAPHELDALVQHASWIRRWADLLPAKITGTSTNGADADSAGHSDAVGGSPAPAPLLKSPARGLALLESAVKPYIAPVVDACLGGGHGAYSHEFAARGCTTTLQDLPGVVAASGSSRGTPRTILPTARSTWSSAAH